MTAVLDTRRQIHTSRRGLHNIPLRGRGGPSHRSTLAAERSAGQAPRILKPALIGIDVWERLQRFAKASKHPTLTIAATELRVHQFALVNQNNRIERELGTKLLERAQRGRPMRLNEEGSTVVRAIRASSGFTSLLALVTR